MVMEQRDPYSVLGVNRDAGEVEIRKAYHKLARLLHPDKFDRNEDPRAWEDAHEAFKAIAEAYSVLRDPGQRSKIDRNYANTRNSQSRPNPSRPKKPRSSPDTQEKSTAKSTPKIHPLRSGCVVLNDLPPNIERRIIDRQNGVSQDQVSLSTGNLTRSLVLTLVFLLWFPGLALFKSGQHWNGWAIVWTLGTTLTLAALSMKSVRDILVNVVSPLRSRIYVTRLYIISTTATEVSWWPLYLLRDFDVTHHYHGDNYTHSTLLLDVLESRLSFTIFSDSESKVERFIRTLQKQYSIFMAAAKRSDSKYFIENDDFADLSPSSAPPKISFFQKFSTIASFFIFLTCYGIIYLLVSVSVTTSSTEKPNSDIATQASRKSQQDFLKQFASATEDPAPPSINLAPVPPRAAEYIESSRDSVAPIVPLPENGETRQYLHFRPIAPLEIITKSKIHHYFIKLVDPNTNMTITTVFVHAGHTAAIDVPVGRWQLKYATGIQWRGENELFGINQTSYYQADELFNFFVGLDQVHGYTIELYEQEDGNLTQTEISPEQW